MNSAIEPGHPCLTPCIERLARQGGDRESGLDVVDEPLVSIDFNHSPYSSSFDLTQTQIVNGKLVRVMSWYDNEMGSYVNMLGDRTVTVAEHMM